MPDIGISNANATLGQRGASVFLVDWRTKFLAILVLASGTTALVFVLLMIASFFVQGLASPLFWACLVTGDVGVLMTSSLALSNVHKDEQARVGRMG